MTRVSVSEICWAVMSCWRLRFAALFVFFVLLLGWHPKAFSQASINVSVLDPVYRDLDRLVSFGAIDTLIVGQRPYSRREIARLISQAAENRDRLGAVGEDILGRLQRDYREELEPREKRLSIHLLDHASFEALVLKSPPRSVPANGVGTIDAVMNPLVSYREGRHLVDGVTTSLETTHWFTLSDYFAFAGEPRFQLAFGKDGSSDDHGIFAQNLYGKFFFHNAEVEVGRDSLVWGQGRNGSLILSQNVRPLDMVKLSNDSPFFLPWIFRHLGPTKASFFYADLGPEQRFPHAYLTGYKISVQPFTFLEFGAGLIVESGGEGSPDTSLSNRILDLFAFSSTLPSNSNKLAGLDFRLRIPRVRGMEFYGEAVFDDDYNPFDPSHYHNLFIDNAGYIAGIFLPRLRDDGTLDLSLEYHKTGKTFYRHGSGFGLTENRLIMGDVLGPDSQGVYGTSVWDVDRQNSFTLHLAFESRSDDVWNIMGGPANHYVKVQDNPEERRYRVALEEGHRFEKLAFRVASQVAYERVQNFNFVSTDGRNNFLVGFNLNFDFGRWTH